MDIGLKYDMTLPDDVQNILSNEFWVLKKFTRSMIPDLEDPVKFTSGVSVFIRKGSCSAEINLSNYKVEAPCVVNIKASQILQLHEVSDDFEAAFIVMSKRFCDNLFLLLKDCNYYYVAARHQMVKVDEEQTQRFEQLYDHVSDIFADKANAYNYQAMVLTLCSFFYETGYKCYKGLIDPLPQSTSRIPDQFLGLVQQHFKQERFLDFYAAKMEISAKHLSRTMKQVTGFTAVEWIDRFVLLEAKVLLKSSNMNIQQISDELHFASQSFFGKFFKKNVGMSPKEFRNS